MNRLCHSNQNVRIQGLAITEALLRVCHLNDRRRGRFVQLCPRAYRTDSSGARPEMFTQAFINDLAAAVAAAIREQISPNANQKRLFTVREAAEYLGRTPKAVEHLIARGTIPVSKLDGKRQIDRAALDKVIEERTFYET